jgi:hypothetical protein
LFNYKWLPSLCHYWGYPGHIAYNCQTVVIVDDDDIEKIINNNNSLTIIGNMAWVAPVMTQAGQPFVIKQGLRYMRDIDWGAQMEEENQGKN